jgi:hypothetical protein
MHLIYTYKHPNKSIIKKADHPKIRFTIKQHRNHLTTTGCVMQSIPNVPSRSIASQMSPAGQSHQQKKLGPAGSSLDLSSACRYALCSQGKSYHYSQDEKAIQHASLVSHPCKGVLSVEESHGKHIGRRG